MAIQFSSSATVLSSTWTVFRDTLTAKAILGRIQYLDEGSVYSIFAFDGPLAYTCTIWKGAVPASVDAGGYTQAQNDADKTDFESNYQSNSNKPIEVTTPSGVPLQADRTLALGTTHFGRTDNGQQQMAVNGLAAGTPLVIWNGTGGSDTGGDWALDGNGTEETYADAGNGTNGVDSGVRSQGQDTRFDFGSNTNILESYDQLSFMMQPKAYPVGSNLEVLWKNNGGFTQGNVLNVEDYAVNMDLDVWQQITIPLSDFGLTPGGSDDVRRLVFNFGSQGGQHFYFDDIGIASAGGGGPFTYSAAPPAGVAWHVSMMVLMLSAPDAGWSSTSFVNISGGLVNGILLRQRKLSTAEVLWSVNSRDNIDLFGRYHPQESFTFDNNELLVGFMIKPGTVADVVVTEDTPVEFVIRDDLQPLTNVRAFLHFGVENLT